MMSIGYTTMCIRGQWDKQRIQCFKIPEFVAAVNYIKPEPGDPPNFPELGLAGTVLSLVDHVDPLIKDKAFTQELAAVANKYIQKVKEGLPENVEIKRVTPASLAKAA